MKPSRITIALLVLLMFREASAGEEQAVPGFQEGVVLLSIGAGTTFTAAGSLIDSERAYNRALRIRALINGSSMTFGPYSLPPIIVPFSYESGPIAEASIQYGFTNHLSAGLKAEHTYLRGRQAESFPNFLSTSGGIYRESIWPGAVRTTLYSGTSYMLLLGFHPLDRARFDPYIELQAGFHRYVSEAHEGVDFDAARFFSRRYYGSGTTVGISAGTNFHLSTEVALKVEFSGYSRHISSGLPSRLFNSGHAQIGAVVNLSGVLKEQGRPREIGQDRPHAPPPVPPATEEPERTEQP